MVVALLVTMSAKVIKMPVRISERVAQAIRSKIVVVSKISAQEYDRLTRAGFKVVLR